MAREAAEDFIEGVLEFLDESTLDEVIRNAEALRAKRAAQEQEREEENRLALLGEYKAPAD